MLLSSIITNNSFVKMNWSHLAKVWSKEFNGGRNDVVKALQRTLPLLQDPTSVPFVCRYRTDIIHPLTTQQIHRLSDMLQTYRSLESLRNRILDKLPETAGTDLKERIETSISRSELEDLYVPFKPLSKGSLEERIRKENPELIEQVNTFWDDNGRVAIQHLKPPGAAVTLLANKIASHTATTDALLDYVAQYVRIDTTKSSGLKDADKKEKNDADKKYHTYYEFSSSYTNLRDHQVLAIKRGIENKALRLSYDIDGERVESRIRRSLIDERIQSRPSSLWKESIHDVWTRLLRKRITSRLWKERCRQAEEKSIQVFCENLRKALLAPPLQPPKPVLSLDPGFQAGIKCALLDESGQLLSNALSSVKFLHNREKGVQDLLDLVRRMKDHVKSTEHKEGVVTIALGNGHGSQEARALTQEAADKSGIAVDIQLVNEAGASVWSVTESASREFPSEQPAAIAAVSIGRRYQNPLPELVKIPPRSLGLGMYQHDLSEKDLDNKLHLTSVSAVAEVGVDGNACSLEILEKIPGLTKTLSQRIIKARPLKGRDELLSRVPGLGPKTFENCAAFILVHGGKEMLDATLVHPESYEVARFLLKQLEWSLDHKELLNPNDIPDTTATRAEKWSSIIDEASTKYSLTKERILSVIDHLVVSMTNPDPRLGGGKEISIVGGTAAVPCVSSDSGSPDECFLLPAHLSTSMEKLRLACPLRGVIGTVRNVVDFGAFVDIGAENDGLLHRSKMGTVPLSSLMVGKEIGVDILSVSDRNRVSIALTGLNLDPEPAVTTARSQAEISNNRKHKRSYSMASTRDKRSMRKDQQSNKRRRIEKHA